MRRALERLDSVFASEWSRHRTGLAHRRVLLEDPATDGRVRQEVLVDLAVLHRAAVKAARSAADREGGPGWLARAGRDEGWVAEHLWAEHVEPLVGVPFDEVRHVVEHGWEP